MEAGDRATNADAAVGDVQGDVGRGTAAGRNVARASEVAAGERNSDLTVIREDVIGSSLKTASSINC